MMPGLMHFGLRTGHMCSLGLLLLSACQSAPLYAPVPALMVATATSAQCLEQMQNAAQRPGAGRVVLTSAAFAAEDRLSIVPSETVLDAAGQPANGRVRSLPESFRLTVSKDGVCTMVREADGQAKPLDACTCKAIH